jgi:SAM-dependent methyltransferase
MTATKVEFDYEAVTWAGGPVIDPDARDFLDHSLHLQYVLGAIRRRHGRVIEIGCGSGRFIASVAAARPDLEAHGCDLSLTALQVAGRDDVRMARADACCLPYDDDSFDAVLMLDVLEHVPDLDAALAEVRRILVPGGVFHLVFPCEGHPWTLLGRIDRLQALKQRFAGHIQRMGPRELKRALAQNGLWPVEERYSYHVLGQLYDAGIYLAFRFGLDMHAARQDKVEGNPRSVVNLVRKGLSNALYWESKALSHVSLGMTIHVTCT